jgi:hypothetical protein
MRFRSRDGSIKRVTMPSGQVAIVGPEWRELPAEMADEAYRSGCIGDVVEHGPPVVAATVAAREPLTIEAVKAAMIKMLEENAKGNFTKDGMPNKAVLNNRCGAIVSTAMFNAAWTELVKETKDKE